MPIQRCKRGKKAGWKWGQSGACYPDKSAALRQMRAVRAAGYAENAFCPTGPGGGVDPTCGLHGLSVSIDTKTRYVTKWESDGKEFFFEAAKDEYGWSVGFGEGAKFGKGIDTSRMTNDPNVSPIKVLRGVERSLARFISDRSPDVLRFTAAKDEESRVVLYHRLGREIARNYGMDLTIEEFPAMTEYVLKRRVENVKASRKPRPNPLRADPTRMGMIRRRFEAEIKRRLAAVLRDLRKLIVEDDGFGLKRPEIFNAALTANAPYRFRFATSAEQVADFQKWLAQRMHYQLLGTTMEQVERGWWTQYVQDGYRKGAGRAFDDVKKPIHKPDTWSERLPWYDGTRREFLESSFGRAVRVEKVKLLAGRVFTELKGVTEEMSTKLSRDLTDGLTQGKSAWDIYKKMADNVGISEKRAMLIARTELTRVHAEGQLDALEEMGVEEVNVMVEWATAGDLRVCKLCQPLDGLVFKIREARGLIPRHAGCRCGFLPANVGEGNAGTKVDWQKTPVKQTRTQKGIEGAIKESLEAEGKGDKTTWPGADVAISKVRPEPII